MSHQSNDDDKTTTNTASSTVQSRSTTTQSSSASSSVSLLSDRFSDENLQVRVLGVCGGIGSGKSTACKYLATVTSIVDKNGNSNGDSVVIHHLDADSLAHAVYAPGSKVIQEIVDVFGKDVLVVQDEHEEGEQSTTSTTSDSSPPKPATIDRKKLGAIVFSDPNRMSKLERLVWPHVQTLIVNKIHDIVQQTKGEDEKPTTSQQHKRQLIVVLEAAVLLDAGWDRELNGVWVVTAPKPTALERLIETRGLSREDADKRIVAQETRRGMGSIQPDVDKGIITGVIDNSGTLQDLQEKLDHALSDPSFWK